MAGQKRYAANPYNNMPTTGGREKTGAAGVLGIESKRQTKRADSQGRMSSQSDEEQKQYTSGGEDVILQAYLSRNVLLTESDGDAIRFDNTVAVSGRDDETRVVVTRGATTPIQELEGVDDIL